MKEIPIQAQIIHIQGMIQSIKTRIKTLDGWMNALNEDFTILKKTLSEEGK